jgi:hypothetical protein
MADKPKMMFIISSGTEAKEKAISGLRMAINIAKSGSAEEVRVMFFGPSEEMISGRDQVIDDLLQDAASLGLYKTACSMIAKNKNIEKELAGKGITLEPAGKVLIEAMNLGFIPITF